ncbi:glycosyltransferase [Micromonospora sediminimaris]|uniref:Glycosyl transferase family 1 n=1 Tax=Micromonospora sediminimaris TaxID=547162 RepID=A0A9W5URK8_9ACTN|nr:glycosyltransferase [Micromonospora sediminimaris]GIJ33116.1 glycosyl transferase family 1 [Micromonospora sediminimaris]SFD14350.1 Glycosyltransferase involved in cell wall bisynthesis [Micromonospora sediminimaris]
MPSYGFLSTHPPTRCGLATFNSALAAHLTADGTRGGIVRVTDRSDDLRAESGVVHTWSTRAQVGWRDAAAVLNTFDVAVVQHEYGIYPGVDGEDVLPLLRRLTVPSIVVLHTVLRRPSARQRSLLEQIVTAAGAVVTMTDTARNRLVVGYTVRPGKVTVIPHGAADHVRVPADRRTRPHLLTWGLLGPGKGVEWALRALARLQDLDPTPTYTVAGRTHPKVAARQGEAYRAGLHRLGAQLGVAHAVDYQDVYRDQPTLAGLIRSAHVVVLPYDSREQVTSGVLIEAVAAGVPVVATAFPHAVELLTGGPGLVVPHQDPAALAAAIRRILNEPGLAARLASRARPLAADLRWPAVAVRYGTLAERLVAAHPPVVSAASA